MIPKYCTIYAVLCQNYFLQELLDNGKFLSAVKLYVMAILAGLLQKVISPTFVNKENNFTAFKAERPLLSLVCI